MVTPSTCCGKSGEGCVCASQAKCSCGEKSALHCSCDKSATENKITGPRCSCRARPAGECTCDRSSTENKTPSGNLCSCGSREASEFNPQDMGQSIMLTVITAACTCEKATDGGLLPTETDFTTSS
ncbi:hypothetical protein LHYA1_G007481 [Lachnellula hyalina]|uniref:DUF7871 domain-containing protein n=1 Tax=Lachnellula hyalina TaxID=1316788 RepID=A0A8H8QVJ1_9HELO|nr:uncharacterized protein LHYA1_G007481 [Lachnellula hyalina]TVY22925.1 hypothetical protein LHYA1_G007481 [Lachnellula hyalina]